MQNYFTSSSCYPLGLYSDFLEMLYIQAFDLLEMLKKEEEMLSSIKEKEEKVETGNHSSNLMEAFSRGFMQCLCIHSILLTGV